MNKILTLVSCFALAAVSWATEKETVKSKITEVTVYTQGAQVFRTANYTVKPGVTEIIIDHVCSSLDPKSLQVKATGNLVILDSKYTLFYPKPEEIPSDQISVKSQKEIKIWEDSLRFLDYELQDLQDEINVLNATKQILINNGAMKGQGKVNDSIQLLKQAIDYYTIKMNDLNKQLSKLNRRKYTKDERRKVIAQKIQDLRNHHNSGKTPVQSGPIHRIVVTVNSNEVVTGKLNFSYIVSGAGWVPLYDIRSDINTGKVNLNYKANVFQKTGTDWENVRLTISTNNPYQNKTRPTLSPWYLDYQVYSQQDMYSNAPQVTRSLNEISVKNEKRSLANGKDQSFYSVDRDARTAADFTTMVNQMISAEFRIDLAYSIKSNNEQYMVLISNTDLEASYKYYTVPKLDASVFLVAQISKLDQLQLVPAKANIFFDGTYMGETFINPNSMDDTLYLSLGKDPNLVVKRTLVQKDSRERIVSNQKEKSNSFTIELKNNKSINATVVIQDQIPVTQNTDIIIEAEDTGKSKYNPVTGLMEWEVTLKPKESKTVGFKYKIKYNKDQKLNF
jgi:uncharacterized protein (TIGR02231 family)